MDPNSGRLYDSVDAATLAGVRNPVELIGTPEDIQRISQAVADRYAAERRAKRKAQKKARKRSRG